MSTKIAMCPICQTQNLKPLDLENSTLVLNGSQKVVEQIQTICENGHVFSIGKLTNHGKKLKNSGRIWI